MPTLWPSLSEASPISALSGWRAPAAPCAFSFAASATASEGLYSNESRGTVESEAKGARYQEKDKYKSCGYVL